MKLMTKEIENKLPKLYSQEKEKNPKIIVKFFHPLSDWTWYAYEGEKQKDGDWMFFGQVDGHEKELGYFTLDQLKEVKVGGIGVERDKYFGYEHRINEFRGIEITIRIQSKEWEELLWISNERNEITGPDRRNNIEGKVREEIDRAIKDYTLNKGGS